MMSGDGELIVEEGVNVSVSGAEEICGTEKIGGEGEGRGSGGEGFKGRKSGMTTRGDKPNGGDAVARVRESEGDENKGESLITCQKK